METPTLRRTVIDEERSVRYQIFAYRDLTEGEAVAAVRFFLSQKRRKPKKNSTIEIHTVIGCRD